MDLSIVIPTHNEADNIGELIDEIKKILQNITNNYEIIIIDGHSSDQTLKVALAHGARVKLQTGNGYAAALKEGLNETTGDYIVTMDADFSHEPIFIETMWENRTTAEVIIASRFISGGGFEQKGWRSFLSTILNKVSVRILDLPIKDISSGYRMYHRQTIRNLELRSTNYDILEEIILRILCQGYNILEIPLKYKARKSGESKARLIKFARSYIKTILNMWKLRNSIACADYDDRAYDSVIPLQRYWQRKRYKIIMDFLPDKENILDIGCSASKIIQHLPQAVGLDIQINKLRFLRRTNKKLINASIFALPFKDESFPITICSEVIEHLTETEKAFVEMKRVIKKGGILIIGTPDYATLSWKIIGYLYENFVPTAYGEEHVSHFTQVTLLQKLRDYGFKILAYKYVGRAELIIKAQKTK